MIFDISEGKKIRVRKINISGNEKVSSKKIINQFSNTKTYIFPLFWRGKYNQNVFENDLMMLDLFYKNKGYKDFHIKNKEVQFKDSEIIIDIEVYEGEKFYYSSFVFEGNKMLSDDELMKELEKSFTVIASQS